MDYEQTRNNLKGYLLDYASRHLEKPARTSSKYNFICPYCGSGSGKNHTAAFNVNSKNPTKWRCFACDKSGDLFDLIGEIEGISNNAEQLKRAAELYGEAPAMAQKVEPVKEEAPTDYTSFFLKASKDIGKTDYHRGLSDKTLERFKIGFAPEWRHPKAPDAVPTSPRLIIPTSPTSYIARDTRADLSGNLEQYKKQKVGRTHIFNEKELREGNKPLFITEGELDALSFEDIGFPAVAIGSTSNAEQLLSLIDLYREAEQALRADRLYIIAMDNDEAGKKAAEILRQGFASRGLLYTSFSLSAYKDANEALQADREGFEDLVKAFYQSAAPEVSTPMEEAQSARVSDRMNAFFDEIERETPCIKTGFETFDKLMQGGLYPGLYVLGGAPATGKTAFVCQIADYLAMQGKDVFIFALEMGANELMARSISRTTAAPYLSALGYNLEDAERDAQTARVIMTKSLRDKLPEDKKKELFEDIEWYAEEVGEHLYIFENTMNLRISDMVRQVEAHKERTGQAPVIIVDYLQIITPEESKVHKDIREKTDEAVKALKILSRKQNTPIFLLSAFSRSSYADTTSDMDAFKESGAIEYTADVLLYLAFARRNEKGYSFNAEKKKNPRKIMIDIIKNRNGSDGESLYFDFFAPWFYFREGAKPISEKEINNLLGDDLELETEEAKEKIRKGVQRKLINDEVKKEYEIIIDGKRFTRK